MGNLILSIFFLTSRFVIFKYFDVYKIDTLKAISINYLVACGIGFYNSDVQPIFEFVTGTSWFLFSVLLFVSIFFVIVKASHQNRFSVASNVGKMSVVIPVLVGVIVYKKSSNFLKTTGIVIALLSVYLTSVKDNQPTSEGGLVLPILLFLGSGIIDSTLEYVERNYVSDSSVSIFSGTTFTFAALIGSVILIYKMIKNKESFRVKNFVAGIVLGIPNYFLIKALQYKDFESSTLFTLNNVGIVVISTVIVFI